MSEESSITGDYETSELQGGHLPSESSETIHETSFSELRPGEEDYWPDNKYTQEHALKMDEVRTLTAENTELRQQQDLDPLTHLPNRRAFDEALPSAEADPNTSIIAFDANNFGAINKLREHGQTVGDKHLRAIAMAIRQAANRYDVSPRRCFRRGGDEFAVFVPNDTVKVNTKNHDGSTTEETISRAEAIVRLAADLYGVNMFAGTYQDGSHQKFKVSLTGVVGDTFEAADQLLQAQKDADKKIQDPQSMASGDDPENPDDNQLAV